MLRKTILFLIVLCFVSASVGALFAAESGNARKGKYTYRKVYESCNKRGEVDSSKPILNPDAKTQDQWKRTFDKKDFDQFKCRDEWNKLSQNDLNDINKYLCDHAADSPTPAKCN
jgi:hypothetical protein